LLKILTALALLYSAVHFASSGVRVPLSAPNLGKFEEETPALLAHLRTGQPVHIDNPVQYGPMFFFVVHPLIRATGGDRVVLARWLYAVQLVCIGFSFWLTCATLRPFIPKVQRAWPLVVSWLAVLWLNFSPLYTILAVKSVETWELLLLCLALYAYLREWRWITAVALAAAGLIKVLPLIFFYYLLVKDRRTFAYSIVALLAFLLVGQMLYGPDMGLGYLPHVGRAAAGNTWGLNWHENISLKGAIAKLIGHLEIPPDADRSRTPNGLGFYVVLSRPQLTATIVLGDIAALTGLALLTWTWLRGPAGRSAERTLWEWSFLVVALLILSPNTTFEYATLALGAMSYAFVRLTTAVPYEEPRLRTSICFGAAIVLLGALIPRQVLNRVTFVSTINQWTGYLHLTLSEAYQYYCFPLAGLLLLAATIWWLRPTELVAVQPIHE
jgi:hypothetical protein